MSSLMYVILSDWSLVYHQVLTQDASLTMLYKDFKSLLRLFIDLVGFLTMGKVKVSSAKSLTLDFKPSSKSLNKSIKEKDLQ